MVYLPYMATDALSQLFLGNPQLIDHEGPDIEPAPLDEQGTRLRDLLLVDLDKCHCSYEIFDTDPGNTFLYIGENGIEKLAHQFRGKIPLRPEPLKTHDLEALFIEAAKRADADPLWCRDFIEAARLVPQGSGLEGIEIEGLPYPIAVTESQFLGQYIQNYRNYGAFIQVNSVQRLMMP